MTTIYKYHCHSCDSEIKVLSEISKCPDCKSQCIRQKGNYADKKDLIYELIAMEKANPTKKITAPGDAFPLYAEYCDKKQEHFMVTTLNGAHEPIKTHVVSIGLVNRTLVHPREIFRPAIEESAAAIMLCHNHPSGNLDPSQEDIKITQRLKQAGVIIGIEILDHLIVSGTGYYSFLEEGKL